MTTSTIQRDNKGVVAIGHIAHHTDTLNKTVKTTEQGVKLAQTIASMVPGGEGIAAGLGLLSGELKTAKSVINATNLFERGYEWGTKNTRDSILSRWQKTANRVALSVAQFFETVLFVDKCSLNFFSSAAMTVCHIPILEGVKNLFYMASAVFGLWYAGQDLSKAISTASKAKESKRKWTALEVNQEKKEELKEKYAQKLSDKGVSSKDLSAEIERLQAKLSQSKDKLGALSGDEAKQMKASIKSDQTDLTSKKVQLVSVTKYENYLQAIEDDNLQSLKDHKIEKYETRIANNKKICEKSWLSIVVDIGKIVMISLGMFVAATAVMFPVLTLPTATLVITSLSLISNSLGLTKNLYSVIGPKQEKEPAFAAA